MDSYKKLEIEYAKHLKVEKCIAVNTGTAALHVALEALCLPENSKVIIPDFTMYASGLAAYYARLVPVFVDCDDNMLIDLDEVERLLTVDKNIKVLMVTHIYGRTVDMGRVMSIAKRHNIRVIEDACEAQGATWDGRPIGSFDIGCFSLYRNKIIHAEEGGVVASNDKEFMKIVEDMKSMSFGDTHNYFHEKIGFNYRMTNSQASMALDSLQESKNNIHHREKIKKLYNKLIDKKYQMPDNRKVVWVYDIKHPNSDLVVQELKSIGISARHSFKPMSSQPLFKQFSKKVGPISKKCSENVFYLHIDITKETNKIIKECENILEILKKHEGVL